MSLPEQSQKRLRTKGNTITTARRNHESFEQEIFLLLPTDNNKLLMQWKGPYVIQEVVGPNDYKVGGLLKTYQANLLKKYVDREEPSTLEKAATACSVADESCLDQDIFELNGIEHKEGPDDINFDQNLSVEQHRQVKRLVREFEDRFTPRPGMADIVQHQVKLTSNTPVHCKPYRLPCATRQELKKDIREMLDLGIIRESKSPYASSVVIVKKLDGSNRVCVDYRKLNKLTVFDPESMPTAEELFQKTGNDKFFSKIDLSKGYWQIKVAEEDIPKTAFVTPDNHWKIPDTAFWDGKQRCHFEERIEPNPERRRQRLVLLGRYSRPHIQLGRSR